MVTLQDIAAGILELKAENPEHDLFGTAEGVPPTAKVWEHNVGFGVYVEAWGNQFLFALGDPADLPTAVVTGGVLVWEKTLHGEFLAREIACDPQECESFAGDDTWFGVAEGSEDWTLAEILDRIRQVIEYA